MMTILSSAGKRHRNIDEYDDHLVHDLTDSTNTTKTMTNADGQKYDPLNNHHSSASSPSLPIAHQGRSPTNLWSPIMETSTDLYCHHDSQEQPFPSQSNGHYNHCQSCNAAIVESGYFGTPLPVSVPDSFWLVAPRFVNAANSVMMVDTESKEDLYHHRKLLHYDQLEGLGSSLAPPTKSIDRHSAYVVIERSGAGEQNSWQMGIQYILIEPSPSLLEKGENVSQQDLKMTSQSPISTATPVITTSRLTFGQWIEAVLARLGFFTSSRLLRQQQQQQQRQLIKPWIIPFECLHEMIYLDRGAQGIVYFATYQNKPVAVKQLRVRCNLADFDHLRTLNHPNLVAFKGVATDSQYSTPPTNDPNDSKFQNESSDPSLSSCYLVMEYCPFGQLCQHLSTIEALSPGRLADWSLQLASGMEYLHSQGIIHRDLKSPNVLIALDQLLKICDFDTSHQLQSNTASNFKTECQNESDILSQQMSLAGTVAWMAPEMIRNERCSEKIDVWSFGVLFWELITLEQPYRNFETIAILFGVGNGSLRLPVPAFTEETACLNDILSICLETDPSLRPSFTDLLEQFLAPVALKLNTLDEIAFMRLQTVWRAQINVVQRIRSKSVASSSSSSSESFGAKQKITERTSICEDISYLEVKKRKILVPVKKKQGPCQLKKFKAQDEEAKENVPLQVSGLINSKTVSETCLPKCQVKRKLATVELDENGNELFDHDTSTSSNISANFCSTSNDCRNHQTKKMKKSLPTQKLKNKITNKTNTTFVPKADSNAFSFSACNFENQQTHRFPTPTAGVDANLFKYFYSLIKRTCK